MSSGCKLRPVRARGPKDPRKCYPHHSLCASKPQKEYRPLDVSFSSAPCCGWLPPTRSRTTTPTSPRIRITPPANKVGLAIQALPRSVACACGRAEPWPARVLSRSSTGNGDVGPATTVRASAVSPVPRPPTLLSQVMESTGNVTGASKGAALNVRRSSRRLTPISRHPDMIGRAFPATGGTRIIAFGHRAPGSNPTARLQLLQSRRSRTRGNHNSPPSARGLFLQPLEPPQCLFPVITAHLASWLQRAAHCWSVRMAEHLATIIVIELSTAHTRRLSQRHSRYRAGNRRGDTTRPTAVATLHDRSV